MKSKEKNKLLRKLLAGFYRRPNIITREKERNEILEERKKNMYYRTRPRMRHELIKAKDKEHKKKLREEEEALGITTLV